MKKLHIRFADEASETIPVADDYELPEFDELDASTMPLFFRIEAADGSEVMFPVQTIRHMHLRAE